MDLDAVLDESTPLRESRADLRRPAQRPPHALRRIERDPIVEGEYDHLPKQGSYMGGTIDEAVEKAKKL